MSILFSALVFGGILGAVAHLPVAVSAAAGTVIGAWLLIFLVRERDTGHGEG